MTVVLCFYDNKHHMVDSARLTTSDAPPVLREEFRKQGYRVSMTGNILAIHTGLPADEAMALAVMYKGDVIMETEAHAKMWCHLLGSAAGNTAVLRKDANITVTLNTIGGISTRTIQGDNRQEIISLKTWILEKAGLMADSKTGNDFIFDNDMKDAGYRFLGYVTSRDEVEKGWPVESHQQGNCWLSPSDVVVYLNGEISSFNRTDKSMLPIFAELLQAAPADTPAPVLVKEEAPKVPFESWANTYADKYPVFISALTALKNNAHPDMQWLMQTMDDNKSVTIWANAVGYPTPLQDGISEAILGDIDNDVSSMTLRVTDFLPQMFNLHFVTDLEHGLSLIERAKHNRIDAIFTPTMVMIRTKSLQFEIERENVGALELYQTLASHLPLSTFEFLTAYLTTRCAQLNAFTVQMAGEMNEMVSVRSNQSGHVEFFPLVSFEAVAEYIAPDAPAPVHVAVGNTDTDLDLLDKAIAGTKHQPMPDAMKKSLNEIIPDTLRKVAEVVTAHVGGDLDICLPVVDINDRYIYSMVFTFESEAERVLAEDAGFGSTLFSSLGGTGAFAGRLVATNRIGRLPLIANEVAAGMGVTGTVRTHRMSE